MKKAKRRPAQKPLTLAEETTQAGEKTARTSARLGDPTHRFHPASGSRDSRVDAMAGLAPQRLRARQSKTR